MSKRKLKQLERLAREAAIAEYIKNHQLELAL